MCYLLLLLSRSRNHFYLRRYSLSASRHVLCRSYLTTRRKCTKQSLAVCNVTLNIAQRWTSASQVPRHSIPRLLYESEGESQGESQQQQHRAHEKVAAAIHNILYYIDLKSHYIACICSALHRAHNSAVPDRCVQFIAAPRWRSWISHYRCRRNSFPFWHVMHLWWTEQVRQGEILCTSTSYQIDVTGAGWWQAPEVKASRKNLHFS